MPRSENSWWGFLKDLFSWRKPYDEAPPPDTGPGEAPTGRDDTPTPPVDRTGAKMIIVAAIAPLLLGACAAYQQAATGYEAAAIRGIQAAEDNNISLWRVNACGTPLSAIMRHPDIVPALRMLCLPAGAMESPALLLEDIKK